MADETPPAKSLPCRRRRGASIALIAVGLLILIPAALCTAAAGGGALLDAVLGGADPQFSRRLLSLIFLFGGPPIAVGAALLVWGLRRDRA
jgi:hypothetical protein